MKLVIIVIFDERYTFALSPLHERDPTRGAHHRHARVLVMRCDIDALTGAWLCNVASASTSMLGYRPGLPQDCTAALKRLPRRRISEHLNRDTLAWTEQCPSNQIKRTLAAARH